MATASNNQRAPRDVVEFPPNVPVTVALKFNQGRMVTGQYGERMMFTLTDERVMFISPEVAGQITNLGVNVRENFTITQRWDGGKTSPRTWEVARVIGEQPNGTCVVPKLPDSPAPKPVASASAAVPEARERGAEILVAESIALVDAYAAVLKHALDTHSGRVKPDEVKSIFLTAVINLSGGKGRAA